MNAIKNKNLELNNFSHNYQFITIYYIVLKVLNKYFGQVI